MIIRTNDYDKGVVGASQRQYLPLSEPLCQLINFPNRFIHFKRFISKDVLKLSVVANKLNLIFPVITELKQ